MKLDLRELIALESDELRSLADQVGIGYRDLSDEDLRKKIIQESR